MYFRKSVKSSCYKCIKITTFKKLNSFFLADAFFFTGKLSGFCIFLPPKCLKFLRTVLPSAFFHPPVSVFERLSMF